MDPNTRTQTPVNPGSRPASKQQTSLVKGDSNTIKVGDFNTTPISQGQSQTMATLKGLVQKGVKVDLGIPLELWDEPSVEVTFLKKQVG